MRRPSARLVLFFAVFKIATAQSSIPGPSLSGLSTAPPQTETTPVLRTTTNLVLIDVVVRDKKTGKSIDGLDRSNFQLLEDGRPQTLTVFEEHHASDAIQASPVPHLPPHVYGDFPRYAIRSAANVLLIDALNTGISDQSYAREQLVRYLRTIPPGTYVAVFLIGSDLRMVTGFTTDLNALLAALGKVRSAGGSTAPGGSADEPASAEPDLDTGSSQEMAQAMRDFSQDTRSLSLQLRQDITVAALKKLARFLATVPGRKNLIWMSAGFPVPLGDPGGGNFAGDFFLRVREVNEMMARARVAIYPVDARGLMTLPNTNPANGPTGGESLSLRGSTTGAVPTANPIPSSWASQHMTMERMADETGGRAFYNTNAIGQSAVSAIADGSTYYTVGYDPTNHKFNGAFRKIKVSLDDKQYELSYRRGYDAVDPSGSGKEKTQLLSPMSAAMLHGGLPLSEIIFEARVLPAGDPQLAGQQLSTEPAGKPDKPLKAPPTRYVIDYSIDPHRLSLTTLTDGRRRVELELAQSVLNRDGARVNQSDAGMEVDLTPEQLSHDLKAGIHMRQEIDVPAENVVLRLGVRDVATERIGTIEIPLRVSDGSSSKN
ncbi:VWA domain-containing protein [Telmatobacter sp. DSM 110680]|uniref:VWA domain-containing protein n=1 Tax=Telmatobacter sp. DSM 110680 TaxID=3036704 RepID=A0AAU7DPF9_9BACT